MQRFSSGIEGGKRVVAYQIGRNWKHNWQKYKYHWT